MPGILSALPWLTIGPALLGHRAAAAELITCGDAPVEGCHPSLQGAIDPAADGDTILVVEAIYAEDVRLEGHTLEIRGQSGSGVGTDSAEAALTVRGGVGR